MQGYSVPFFIGAVVVLLGGGTLFAQISLDGTLGRSGPVAGPQHQIGAELGRQAGPNLFHSFKEFNLRVGESATFSGPASVQNILSRVTGGQRSEIHGSIRSEIAGANFYFLNPSGVLFGPEASVNVDGSFAVSTADYLKLGQGGRFDASETTRTILTAAPVEAFGFLNSSPSDLAIVGANLQVPNGESFSLIGGDIKIDGGAIRATGGRIHLIGQATAGEAPHPDTGDLSANAERGTIELSNGAVIDVGGGSRVVLPDGAHNKWFDLGAPIGKRSSEPAKAGGGKVVIRAGRLSLDGSGIYQTNEEYGSGGGVDVRVSDDVILKNASHIITTTLGPGQGGDVQIEAGRIGLENRSLINTTTAGGAGRAGDISFVAHALSLSNGSQSVSDSFGLGDTGDMNVSVNELFLHGEGSRYMTIMGTFSYKGAAGSVTITAKDQIQILNEADGSLVGFGSYSVGFKPAGDVDVLAGSIRMNGNGAKGELLNGFDTEQTLIASVSVAGPAPSGNIRIQAQKMELLGYCIVSAATYGLAQAGSVSIIADELVLQNSSIVSSTAPKSLGNGGSVHVQSGKIQVTEAGGIGARSSGAGNAGSVDVVAREILLDFGSIYADAREAISGHGGTVHVQAENLEIFNGGNIEASTLGPGNAGDVSVQASRILIDGRRQTRPFESIRFGPTFLSTGIGSQSLPVSAGQTTALAGRGGNVHVVADTLEILGSSGAISAQTRTSGDGGNIHVEVGALRLGDGGNINSSSTKSGTSGSILVESQQSILLTSGSSITTAAEESRAEGIIVRSPQGIELRDSQITSQAGRRGGELRLDAGRGGTRLSRSQVISEAGGDGGDIFLDGAFVTLNASHINANARDANAGNIWIDVDFLLSSDATLRNITASSARGLPGQINILGPSVDLTGSLISLPGSLSTGEASLPEHCAINLGQHISSFVISGRGGLPIEPGGWQPSLVPSGERRESEPRSAGDLNLRD